jgi:hypothetical protein
MEAENIVEDVPPAIGVKSGLINSLFKWKKTLE